MYLLGLHTTTIVRYIF